MSTFTIPFPEYDIADRLTKEFTKKDDFSIAIPFSRQQKFYDLVLMNGKNKKIAIIQVKSSRTWSGGSKNEPLENYSFFNKFDISENYSDYYFIYMTYPVLSKDFNPSAKWDKKILVFSHKEMSYILDHIMTIGGKKENRFSFGFNPHNNIVEGARGFKYFKDRNFSKNLLENKLSEIRKGLK